MSKPIVEDKNKDLVITPDVRDVEAINEKNMHNKHEIGADLYAQANDITWTAEEEKKVRIKIDWRVLPAFCILEGLAYLDKTALNYGKLFGMDVSLNATHGRQFSWFASSYYFGYLVAAWPVNILLQKYPTARTMSVLAFCWGCTIITTPACHNLAGGIVNRVVLGALEAAVYPGLSIMTPFWWNLEELPLRHMAWVSMNCPFAIFGGLLSYGLGHTTSAVPSWALLFFLLGALTIIWSVVQFFVLPDSPANAFFLSPREKIIAVKRVARNRVGTRNTQFKWEQVRETFTDYRTYLMLSSTICAQLPNGIVAFFSTSIISSLGFNEFETVLLDIPYQLCCLWPLLLAAWIASRYKNMRVIMLVFGNVVAIGMTALLTWGPREWTWGRLVAFWLTGFSFITFGFSVLVVTSNIGGYTKRNCMTVITFLGFCIGNIVGPFTLVAEEESQSYPTATKCMIAGFAGQTVLMGSLGLSMWWENKRRDRQATERGETYTVEERELMAERMAMEDVTDRNNPYMRYVY